MTDSDPHPFGFTIDVGTMVWEIGATYDLTDGSQGEVRVIAKNERTVIAFHQEHLPDGDAREDRRRHFVSVLDKLNELVTGD